MTLTARCTAAGAALILAAALAATPLAQQQPSPPAASLAGRVIDAISGAPLPGAAIGLVAGGGLGRGGMIMSTPAGLVPPGAPMRESNDEGRFDFGELPAGVYRVTVGKDGYLTGAYSALPVSARPDGRGTSNLTLKPGERRHDVVLALWPEGRISGTVLDDRGEPIVQAAVQLLEQEHCSDPGERPAVQQTDDRGQFVFSRLRPGAYLVRLADARVGDKLVRPAIYHPNALLASASTVITLGFGEVRTGVDIVSPLEHSGASIAGRVTGLPPAAGPALVHLLPERLDDLGGCDRFVASTAADGTFSFAWVPPGTYRLAAWRFPDTSSEAVIATGSGLPSPVRWRRGEPLPALPQAPTLAAEEAIVVPTGGAGRLTAALAMRAAARVNGRVEFDPAVPLAMRDRLPAVPVTFWAVDRPLQQVPVSGVAADGRFTSIGLPPGRYDMSLGLRAVPELAGWYVSSVQTDGREVRLIDVAERDVEVAVTLTNRPAELSVQVQDEAGRPVPAANVIFLVQDGSHTPTLAAQVVADANGGYKAQRFQRGDYLVAAVRALPLGWPAARVLSAIAGQAVPARVAPGEKAAIVVRVADR